MNRFVWFGALLASACGSSTDDRPPTLAYISETILAPSCATAECHSAFKQEVGDVFDTAASTRRTIVANGLALYPDDMEDPSQSVLIRTLTVGAPSILSTGNVRMPYDAPMPDADVQLIEAWIALGVPGAQCEPNPQGLGCLVRAIAGQPVPEYSVVECQGGNVGAVMTVCPQNQICDLYHVNGQCVPR